MNPLSWLPSIEVLNGAWNIYGVICLILVFASGVVLTRHTKKPLLYRMILAFLVAWCLQITFVETTTLFMLGALYSISPGNFDIHSWSQIDTIAGIPFEVRPMYIILPIVFLIYFNFADKKSPADERMFDWRRKWILIMLLVVSVCTVMYWALGYNLPQTSYPPESIDRYIIYYLNYVPIYTTYAILGIKSWNSRKQRCAQ